MSPSPPPLRRRSLWAALVLLLALTPGAAQAASGFVPAAPLLEARTAHTATLLPDGKLLAVGGAGPDAVTLASAELYDPATDRWSAAASMPEARAVQTATLLRNGKLLITGGDGADGSPQASAVLYDPASDSWAPAASMTQARRGQTATLLPDGKVLVAGGGGVGSGKSRMANAEVYDPIADSWTPTLNDMGSKRMLAGATLLETGRVLVAGGYASGFTETATADEYDPATNRWTAVAPMGTARAVAALTPLANGRVLTAGGVFRSPNTASAELYDPQSRSWSPTGSLQLPRADMRAVRLSGGSVLLTGWEDQAELYDPLGATFSLTGPIGDTLLSHSATLLGNGKVLIAGGCNCGPARDETALYTPPTTAETVGADFGDQPVAARSPLVRVTAENTGRESLWVTGARLSGPSAAEFAVEDDRCTGRAVLPGRSCSIGVRLTPAALGARQATLTLDDNESAGSQLVPLVGVGTTPPSGPKGDPGSPGTPGDPGSPGAPGTPGAAGPQGTIGPQGLTGPLGTAGARGETGLAGSDGTAGAPGPKGDKGDPGVRGETGPAGAPGTLGAARVSCSSKVRKVRGRTKVTTRCTLRLGKAVSRTTRVRLAARGGSSAAAGTVAAGRDRTVLVGSRTIAAGRYRLVLSHRDQRGRRVASSAVLRLASR